MPKKVYKVEAFEGGINQKSDARDLEDNQLAEAFNVDVSNKGIIRIPGNDKIPFYTLNSNNVDVNPAQSDWEQFKDSAFDTGWGLFQFSHDFGMDKSSYLWIDSINILDSLKPGVYGESEFICINDGARISIWCDNGYAQNPHGGDWSMNALTLGGVSYVEDGNRTDKVRPVYYKSGNSLRVCDSNFLISDSGHTFDSFTNSTGIIATLSGTFSTPNLVPDYTANNNVPIPNYIKINDEILAIVKQVGANITVRRAQFGTKEQTHSSGDKIYFVNVPKKLIGISPSMSEYENTREYRLTNASLYSDTGNTTFTTPANISYSGWRECIQSLAPPNNFIIPGLTVYDGQVTAMATSGVVNDSAGDGGSDDTDAHQIYNEPNTIRGTTATNLVIPVNSNPEKVLFSLHESKSSDDNVIIGQSTSDGGAVNNQNAITVTGVAGTNFATSGFVVGETILITGSSVTNGVAEILATVSATEIQITGEHEANESSGFEIRLEKDRISEDLLNKYVFGMSFMYDGGGSEVQESPVKMGQVHSGLISHDASIVRNLSGWKTGTNLNANTTLTSTADSTWYAKDGSLFFDDSAISADQYLIYSDTSAPIVNDAYYKISLDVTIRDDAKLIIYPPGTNVSATAGTIGDGSSDGSSITIDASGTYLFYAQAESDTEHVFVAEGVDNGGADGDGIDDITIHNVQVFEATPKEMSASNAISMESWQGVPKIFSSFNMSGMDKDTAIGGYKWDAEIIGYKIYMKQVDSISQSLTDEWLLALKVDLREGEFINYSNNSELTPLHLGNNYSSTSTSFATSIACTNKVGGNATGRSYYSSMKEIPLHTYESENGYKADTVTCAMYKTATQVGRRMYIGNILIDGHRYPDRMLESPTDRPDTFPNDGLHYIDVATADGDDIIHLDSLGNEIIQFKKKTAYVIEVLDEGVDLVNTWSNAGIVSPSQVVKAGDGLVWVNNYGLFYYDGSELKTITSESFDLESWVVNENKKNATILGYDPYSKKVIIMTSNVTSHDNGGYIYDLTTNSITEHQNLFTWYSSIDEFQ